MSRATRVKGALLASSACRHFVLSDSLICSETQFATSQAVRAERGSVARIRARIARTEPAKSCIALTISCWLGPASYAVCLSCSIASAATASPSLATTALCASAPHSITTPVLHRLAREVLDAFQYPRRLEFAGIKRNRMDGLRKGVHGHTRKHLLVALHSTRGKVLAAASAGR